MLAVKRTLVLVGLLVTVWESFVIRASGPKKGMQLPEPSGLSDLVKHSKGVAREGSHEASAHEVNGFPTERDKVL